MKTKLIPSVPLLFLFAGGCGKVGPSSFSSVVQSASGTSSFAGTSVSAAFTKSNASGNTIIVVVAASTAPQMPTDSAGNTYTQASTKTAGSLFAGIYYAANIRSTVSSPVPNSVTVNFPVATSGNIAIFEYSGLSTSTPVEGSVSDAGLGLASSSVLNSSSLVTNNSNDLLFGVGVSASGTFSAGSAFLIEQPTAFPSPFAVEDETVSTVGSYQATFNLNVSAPWICILVAFER